MNLENIRLRKKKYEIYRIGKSILKDSRFSVYLGLEVGTEKMG